MAGSALNLQIASDLGGAFVHDPDPKMAHRDPPGVEPAAVILDVHRYPSSLFDQGYLDLCCGGVNDYIV